MTLALDYQTIPKTQRQHTINLLDQLSFLSTALKDLREQKRLLREQKYALFAQQHAISEQQQAMIAEESVSMQEESAILHNSLVYESEGGSFLASPTQQGIACFR
jgi:hypothetical protein